MPIDDALELLEGAPNHILKKPLEIPLTIPKTLREFQKMYADKFNINIYGNHNINFSYNKNESKIEYILILNEKMSIERRSKFIFLRNEKGLGEVKKGIKFQPKIGTFEYVLENTAYEPKQLGKETKKELREWGKDVEKYILKEIPELEGFVKKYAN
jgi:hypothetical protein